MTLNIDQHVRKLCKAHGGGEVRIVYTGTVFRVTTHPTDSMAREIVVAEFRERPPADNSVSLQEFNDAIERAKHKILAAGRGKTIAEALENVAVMK